MKWSSIAILATLQAQLPATDDLSALQMTRFVNQELFTSLSEESKPLLIQSCEANFRNYQNLESSPSLSLSHGPFSLHDADLHKVITLGSLIKFARERFFFEAVLMCSKVLMKTVYNFKIMGNTCIGAGKMLHAWHFPIFCVMCVNQTGAQVIATVVFLLLQESHHWWMRCVDSWKDRGLGALFNMLEAGWRHLLAQVTALFWELQTQLKEKTNGDTN
ncbi:hypothetical protein RLOC_00003200 [Lonchura striata]|uniref:Uncharacterized protein n=1 Tax=Lonchura striata TaxID=40157 RepID=A0A218V255_9PASE|nr:hypothetical protein RLOC_00003200 [Lonchura striata domestica]